MATNINLQVGKRLRELRTERKLTIKALSELTGVSQSMLSAIEKGDRSPTLTILNKINDGLKISLSALLDAEKDDSWEMKLYPREEMKHIPFKRDCMLTMMLEYNANARIEVFRQDLKARTRWDSEAAVGGEVWEYCMPISGTLTVEISGKSVNIRTGDVFTFLSDKPHAYINNTDEDISVILINSYR